MTLEQTQSTTESARILICAADPAAAWNLQKSVTELGYRTAIVERWDLIAPGLFDSPADVCLINWPEDDSVLGTVVADFRKHRFATQLIKIDQQPSASSQVLSDWDILETPYTPATLSSCLRSAVLRSRLLSENLRLKQQLDRPRLSHSLPQNPAVRELCDRTAEVADGNGVLLIQGEAGTNLSEIAQNVHQQSWRNQRPLIKVDCSVLSADCLLLQLFGDAGTSDPTVTRREGLVDSIDGGTLVLLDIDTIAIPVQRRLADMLQKAAASRSVEKSFTRQPRVIACTHVDLQELVRSNKFAADLFLLLDETVLTVPPLRERKEEIAGLTEGFLAQFAAREGRPRKRLNVDALALLESYEWPRNHEELWTVLERACALDAESRLTAEMIEPWMNTSASNGRTMPGLSLKEMERKLIETTFTRCGGNRERTAQSLQIGLRTLSGKLRDYGYPPRGAPGSNLARVHRKAA